LGQFKKKRDDNKKIWITQENPANPRAKPRNQASAYDISYPEMVERHGHEA
jgi:hypothetical protein